MENLNERTTNQLAIVTGASSGIGYELANIFAKNGFDLIVVAENPEIIEAAHAFRTFGTQVEAVQADLSTFVGVEELYGRIKKYNRNIDAVAMNAGVGVGGRFVETSLDREIAMINLNVISLVHLTKKLLPQFIQQGHGKILFTSSVAADMPGPYYAVYAATKSFVQSFSEALREEVRETGVTITALQPGATDTHFFERADMLDTKAGASKKDSPTDVAQEGFDAMMAGKDHVVAGSFMNKVQTVMSKIIPETQASKLHAAQVKPGSAPH